MRHFDLVSIALVSGLLLLLAGEAQSAVPVALVIGNDHYANLGADAQLNRARDDASAVAASLQKIGYHVILKLDASRDQMLDGLDAASNAITPGSPVLVYYAGHGIEVSGANYLIPADAPAPTSEPKDLTDHSVPLAGILDTLKARGARISVIILDACRSNPYSVHMRGAAGERGLARIAPSDAGFFMIYSAGIGQTALDRLPSGDSDRNSVFTRVLLRYLPRTELPLTDVAKGLQREVSALAAEGEHTQMPAYYDQLNGDFSILGLPVASTGPVASALPPPQVSMPVTPRPQPPTAVPGRVALRINGYLNSQIERAIEGLAGIKFVSADVDADLELDVASGNLRDRTGRIVFRFGHSTNLALFAGVFAKWTLIDMLQRGLGQSSLALSLDPASQSFAEGITVELAVEAPSPGIVIAFDIGSDGSVSLIVPDPVRGAVGRTDAGGHYRFSIATSAPDGIDQIVVVFSPSGMPALESVLRAVHGHALDGREETSLLHALEAHADSLAIASFETVQAQR